MALQDDIMGLLSSIGEAGDRATNRGRRGEELYANISSILGDNPNYRKALRELTGLGSRPDMTLEEEMSMDPILGGKVADIIEKYMADASSPDEEVYISDATAGEYTTPVTAPDAAPRTPVTVEPLEPMLPPGLDEAAMASMEREIRDQDEGLAGLMAGMRATPTPTAMPADEFSSISPEVYQQQYERGVGYVDGPRRAAAPASVGNTVARALAAERAQDTAGVETRPGDPRSRVNAPELASDLIEQFREMTPEAEAEVREGVTAASVTALTSLPPARLAAAAGQVGMKLTPQIIRAMSSNPQLKQQVAAEVAKRTGTRMMRDRATGRMIGSKDVGPFLPKPTGTQMMRDAATGRMIGKADVGPFTKSQELLNQAQRFRQGLPQPAFKQGGNIRDKIMKTYGGM